MTVVHARDLAALEACAGLRRLTVLASDVPSFDFCEARTELTHLQVLASRVASFDGIAFCTALEHIDLLFTSISEAGDLMGVSTFARGMLVGNPWTEQSWSYLQSEAAKPHMLLQLPAEADWKLCVELWNKAQACWGVVAGSQRFVVRPGLPELTSNVFDALALTSLRHELRQSTFDLASLFRDYQKLIAKPELTELAGARVLGRSTEASQWIAASALPDDDKAALTRFVGRFPEVVFYRASDQLIASEAQSAGGLLPPWYAAQRATLDGWRPNTMGAGVRFSQFAMDGSPRAARADSLTYDLGLYPFGGDLEDAMHAAGLVGIGQCREDAQLMLALRSDRREVYEYSLEDLTDAIGEGRDLLSSVYPSFPSYASMLDHVVSLHPADADAIAAS